MDSSSSSTHLSICSQNCCPVTVSYEHLNVDFYLMMKWTTQASLTYARTVSVLCHLRILPDSIFFSAEPVSSKLHTHVLITCAEGIQPQRPKLKWWRNSLHITSTLSPWQQKHVPQWVKFSMTTKWQDGSCLVLQVIQYYQLPRRTNIFFRISCFTEIHCDSYFNGLSSWGFLCFKIKIKIIII